MKNELDLGCGSDRSDDTDMPLVPANMLDECCEQTDSAGDADQYAYLTRKFPVLDARRGRCAAADTDTFQLDGSLARLFAVGCVEAPPTGGYDRFRAGLMFKW